MAVLYGLFLCCHCSAALATYREVKAFGCNLVFAIYLYICKTFLWIVLGSMILNWMQQLKNVIEENETLTTEFDHINECADAEAKVDVEAFKKL